MLQVTVPVAPGAGDVQPNTGPLSCVSDANVVLAGSVSVSAIVAAAAGPALATVIVYAMVDPGVAPAGAVLTTLTSARTTVVVTVDELLPGVASAVIDNTVAVFEIGETAAAPTFATSVNVAGVAGASVAIVQVTVPALPAPGFAHVNTGPVPCTSDAKVVPAGKASVRLTVLAFDGPLLTTVIAYVAVAPATTVAGPVMLTARSLDVTTFAAAVEVLLLGLLSGVTTTRVAVFDTVPIASDATLRTTVNVAVAPAASGARLHDSVPPCPAGGSVHVNAGPVFCVYDANVVPAGSVSVNVTCAESDGPLLVTVIA